MHPLHFVTMLDLNSLTLAELFAELTGNGCLHNLIDAMWHDIGRAGDITTDSIIDEKTVAVGTIAARRPGVVAGLAALPEILVGSDELVEVQQSMTTATPAAPGPSLRRLAGTSHGC